MNKLILVFFLTISALIPPAFSAALIRLDQSQTGGIPPTAVQSGYRPYCNAAGVVMGYYLPAESYLAYTSSVLSTVTEIDAVSGISGAHRFVTTMIYTSGNLTKVSCPVLQ